MEACTTAHYWTRELARFGYQVRLMPAKYVKAYVKRNKNDAADAEAICEAVRRPTTRFVGVKSAEQQGRLMQQQNPLVSGFAGRRPARRGRVINRHSVPIRMRGKLL
jgi:transposase